jgi:hypothetical protein
MASDPLTSISIHASTHRMLQPFKRGDMTWDDVLVDFSEEHLPDELVTEMIRRAKSRPLVPLSQVLQENKLE